MKILLAILLAIASSASAATVTLTWDPNPAADQVNKYSVYEETAPGQFTKISDTPSTTITIPNVIVGTHVYRVTASNVWAESQKSDPVSTPPGIPAAPTRLIIITISP